MSKILQNPPNQQGVNLGTNNDLENNDLGILKVHMIGTKYWSKILQINHYLKPPTTWGLPVKAIALGRLPCWWPRGDGGPIIPKGKHNELVFQPSIYGISWNFLRDLWNSLGGFLGILGAQGSLGVFKVRCIYGCFLKWWYPQSPPQVLIIFSRKTHGFVGETQHFRKTPTSLPTIHFLGAQMWVSGEGNCFLLQLLGWKKQWNPFIFGHL